MKYRFLLLFFLTPLFLGAQTVDVYFPKFAGSNYVFTLNQGTAKDTVQAGSIEADGRLSLVVPEKYKGYYGLAGWALSTGGGLEFIIPGGDFSVSCTEATPNADNIRYEGNQEMDALLLLAKQQDALLQEVDSLFQLRNNANDSLLAVFNEQYRAMDVRYGEFMQSMSENPSYGAFYLGLTNRLRGIGPTLNCFGAPNTLIAKIKQYVENEVNMTYLYTSGLWNYLISMTFELYPDKTDFGNVMVKIMKRIDSDATFERFANDLAMICSQFDWPDAQNLIFDYIEQSRRIPNPKGLVKLGLELNKIKIGSPAPPIKGIKDLKNTLIIFYESGCEHCEAQLDTLRRHYAELQKREIKIISIATDKSPEVFEYHAKNMPWKDKLCDFKGYEGENIQKYGIIGTPTIYFTDSKGNIIDRQAKIENITSLKLLK
ncbi:MAG: thioredoxin family protein [Dysgonamonadaceae bacterium]|jgi:peroxiredoxin|nr:thioredoxin family protein [Dysgonamonadaceae bacterium]